MIGRREAMAALKTALEENLVAALLGRRQCGKRTLARMLMDCDGGHWFDPGRAKDRAALAQADLFLKKLTGFVVRDEVQRQPELFAVLWPLADRPARFLLLGSAPPDIVKGVSESLAGRVGFADLNGFHAGEIGGGGLDDLQLRGGFPRRGGVGHLLFRGGKSYGIQFKVNDGPKMTTSRHIAFKDLNLERAWILHPGTKRYSVHEKVEALPLDGWGVLAEVLHQA